MNSELIIELNGIPEIIVVGVIVGVGDGDSETSVKKLKYIDVTLLLDVS